MVDVNDDKGTRREDSDPMRRRLLEDYAHGVVHLAVLQRAGKVSTYQLMFGLAELLPNEVPPMRMPEPVCRKLSVRSNSRVWIVRTVASAEEVLDWYLAARAGSVALEAPNSESGDSASKGHVPDEKVRFFEEPRWPGFVLAVEDQDAIPFLADWYRCPRVHHLLQGSCPVLETLTERDRKTVRDLLLETLHVDCDEYPEFVGSLHLVLPNPVLRHAGHRLADRPNEAGGESVLVRLRPRSKCNASDMKIALFETRATGVGSSVLVAAEGPLTKIDLEGEVDHIAIGVLCPVRGLVYLHRPASFIQKISINMNVITGTRDVRLTDDKGRVRDKYTVDVVGADREIEIGDAPPPSARQLLHRAKHRRETRRLARRQDQAWFSGNPEDAIRFIRGIVGRTSNRILIVDPYFGHEALLKVVMAVSNYKARVLALSSQMHLKTRVENRKDKTEDGAEPSTTAATGTTERTLGHVLMETIAMVQAKPMTNPIEVRAMPYSKRPLIHDRFLAVDQQVWALGSSLNNFGKRGTIAVKLPDPEPVLAELLATWDVSEELGEWLQRKSVEGDADEVDDG